MFHYEFFPYFLVQHTQHVGTSRPLPEDWPSNSRNKILTNEFGYDRDMNSLNSHTTNKCQWQNPKQPLEVHVGGGLMMFSTQPHLNDQIRENVKLK